MLYAAVQMAPQQGGKIANYDDSRAKNMPGVKAIVQYSRGVAVDLTLTHNGEDLDMGTDFDEFSRLSYHGNLEISKKSYRNRLLLLGIMTDSGWDFYRNEWWHYQLFNPRRFPIIDDVF